MSDEVPIQVDDAPGRPFYLQPWFIALDLAVMVLIGVIVLMVV